MKTYGHIRPFRPKQYMFWLLFLCVTAGYFFLIAPTVSYQGFSWDEAIDFQISKAYLSLYGIFFGISLDNSQTRLPMFTVSLVYRLFGGSDLLTARWVSVGMGWLTLLAVYIYGKSRFSQQVGLLASGLLAISPFFLSFARVAFTESDIYLACTLSWLLVAVLRLHEQPTVGRAAVAGIILGLSLASKATSFALLPAIWIDLYIHYTLAGKATGNVPVSADPAVKASVVLFWSLGSVLVMAAGVYGGILFGIDNYSWIIQLIHYGLVSLGWIALFAWVLWFRNHTAGYIPLAFLLTSLGLFTFLVFPPDHFTNSGILQSLYRRAEAEVSFSAAFMMELAALHLLSILFKSTLLLGAALLISAIVSLFWWRQVGVSPLLFLVSYFVGLLLLPLGQTFYSVPLLPFLSLLAANAFMRLWSSRRKIAFTVTLITLGWWGMEMAQCYPDYHLNGYQWLGSRTLFGRSSIGYRSVVYTSSDGVQQAVEWLNANADANQTAQLYVGPWHIVRQFAPDPSYLLTDGFEGSLLSKPDYVVIHINEILWSGNSRERSMGDDTRYPFDRALLEQEYKKVYSVRRAFDLEIVSIWRRR